MLTEVHLCKSEIQCTQHVHTVMYLKGELIGAALRYMYVLHYYIFYLLGRGKLVQGFKSFVIVLC